MLIYYLMHLIHASAIRPLPALFLLVTSYPGRTGMSTAILISPFGTADKILDSEKEREDVRDFVLNELDFKGSQSCLRCKAEEAADCVLRDELTPVLSLMLESDAWVVGTPVYMGQSSGQLKLLMDRMYGFSGPGWSQLIPPGKKAVIVITQGAPVERHADFEDFVTRQFARRGAEVQIIKAGNRRSSGEVRGLAGNHRQSA